jgi:hypothetical protein
MLNCTNNEELDAAAELNTNRAHRELVHGTNFRNAYFQGAPILDYSTTPPQPRLDNSFFDHLPKKGVLEFDYVSTARPALDVQPMARSGLNKILDDVNAARHLGMMALAQAHLKDRHLAVKKWKMSSALAAKKSKSARGSRFGGAAQRGSIRKGSSDSGGSLRRSSTLQGAGMSGRRSSRGGAFVRTVSGSRRKSGILSKTTPSSRRDSELASHLLTPAASRTMPQQRNMEKSVRATFAEKSDKFVAVSGGEPVEFVASTTMNTLASAAKPEVGAKMGQPGQVGYGRRKRGVKVATAAKSGGGTGDEEERDTLAALPMKPLPINIAGSDLAQVAEEDEKQKDSDSDSSSSSSDDEGSKSRPATPSRKSPSKGRNSPTRSPKKGYSSPTFRHKKRSASAKAERQADKAKKRWEKEVRGVRETTASFVAFIRQGATHHM